MLKVKKKYGCHGNQDCYLSPFHKEKQYIVIEKAILLLHISFKYDKFKSTTQICINKYVYKHCAKFE